MPNDNTPQVVNGVDNETLFKGLDNIGQQADNADVNAAADLASKVDANQYGEASKVSQQTGIPVTTALSQPKVAKQEALRQEIIDAVASSPTLRSKIKDPHFAQLASDDARKLMEIDKKAKEYGEMKAPPPTEASTYNVLRGWIQGSVENLKESALGTKVMLDDMLFNKGDIKDIKDPEERGAAQAHHDALMRDYEQLLARKAEIRPEITSYAGNLAYDTVGSIVDAAPLLATGNTPLILAGFYAKQQPAAYLKYRSRNADIETSFLASNAEASVAAAAWALPMKYLTGTMGKVGAGEFLAGLMGRQIPAGLITEWGDTAIDTAVANPNKTWADYWRERPQATLDTILSMALFSGVLAVPNAVLARSAANRAKAQDALLKSGKLTQLKEMVDGLGMLKHSPDEVAGFMNQALKDGEVFIDRADMEKIAKAHPDEPLPPIIRDQVRDSNTAGTAIRIPIGDYLGKMGSTEMGKAMLDYLRHEPDGMTLPEAKKHLEENAGAFDQEAKAIIDNARNINKNEQDAQTVKAYFLDQLKKVGRFTGDVNKLYAAMHGAFYKTMAPRAGMSPTEMLKKYQLKVTGEEMPGDLMQGGVQNNASGESAASVEAINRVQREKQLGQNRYVIERNGTVRPLVGVGSVDVRPQAGQTIVQRGVGKSEFTVLDHANDVTPYQKAAALAAAKKFHESSTLKQEAPGKPLAQVSWEAAPGRSTGELPQLPNAPMEQQQEYLKAVHDTVAPEGKDELAKIAKISGAKNLLGLSAWEGKVGAGGQTFVPVPDLSPEMRDKLDLYAALKGYVMGQDAVVWHQPHFDETDAGKMNGADIHTNGPLSADEMRKLYSALNERFGGWDLAPGYTENGARVLNFREGLKNENFQRGIDSIMEAMGLDFGSGGAMKAPYRSEGSYISNDWSRNYKGEDYERIIKAKGGEAALARARQLRASVQAVNDAFAEKYGWDKKNKPSVLDSIRNGKGVIKEHGTKKPGSLSVIGVHFSTEPREQLSSSAFGTGVRSAESQRLARAPSELKHRVYFYVSEGKGVKPEWGVGNQAHMAVLHNIYDAHNNPLGLDASNHNDFEKAVIDAGFNGYYVKNFYGDEETPTSGVVLLGPRMVDVTHIEFTPPSLTTAAQEKQLYLKQINDILADAKPEEVPTSFNQDNVPPDENAPRPTYYSVLARTVDSLKVNKAPAGQWESILQGLVNKGVKKDEIVMSGILDWLKYSEVAKRSISKQEIQNFLKENGVQPAEKILGDKLVGRELQAITDEEPIEMPSESEIEARAEELWREDLPDKAENYARESDMLSYDTELHAPNVRIVELPPDMLRPEKQYAIERLDYPDRKFPWDSIKELDEIGDAEGVGYHELDGAPTVFDSEQAAQHYINQYAHYYDFKQGEAPYFYYRFYEGEPEGQFENVTDAVNAAEQEVEQRFQWEVDAYIEGSSFGDDGSADYWIEQAREELMDEDQYREYRAHLSEAKTGVPATRHGGKWQSNGGDNYVEVVISDPKAAPWNESDSTHFATDTGGRTLAWGRGKTHIATDGLRMFFNEEFQSQRAQAGREKGFQSDAKTFPLPEEKDLQMERIPGPEEHLPDNKLPEDFVTIHDSHAAPTKQWYVVPKDQPHARAYFHGLEKGTPEEAIFAFMRRYKDENPPRWKITNPISGDVFELAQHSYNTKEEIIKVAMDWFAQKERNRTAQLVPDAPFVKDTQAWTALIVKRMLRYAVDNGHDWFGWTPGIMQTQRYEGFLRERVDHIAWAKTGEKVHIIASKNNSKVAEHTTTAKEISSIIGSDMAKQINDSSEGHGVITGDNLRLDKPGMAAFYGDENGNAPNGKPAIVTSVVNKILKQLGIDEKVHAVDATIAEGQYDYNKVPGFKITPEMVAKVQGGFPLFQERAAGPRGQITFPHDITKSPSTIALLQNADLSTFLHESSHFFLEVLASMAKAEGAPADIVKDFNTTMKWFGVKPEDWHKMTLEQKRQYHEQWATAWEKWSFEGKAPTPELQPMFTRFRAWLKDVYKSLTGLNVNLTDEVRGVFGRMLADEQAIKTAEEAVKADPLFKDAKAAGMSDAEYEAYKTLPQESTDEALAQLDRRSLANMKWMSGARGRYLRQLQKEAADKRKAVKIEVRDELAQTPVYRVYNFLKSGEGVPLESAGAPHKLSINALREMYPADAFPDGAPWTQLPRWMVAEEGLHPNEVARLFGLGSGDELVRMMIAADPFKVAVDAATDQRMLEKYGDMNSTEAMNRAADEAVHNEARTKFVAMELNALAKLANASQPGATYRVTTQIAKNVAERIVNTKRVKDLRPNQFKAAQQKLAKDAAAAFKKGNLLEAATLKRQQLVSMYALKAAEKANDFALKARTYLKKFDSPGVRKKVDPTQLSQIDAILDRYDVRKLSPKDVQRKETLAAWIKKQEDMGIEPAIDPDVADEMQRKHYSQLTVEELRGLIDSIRNIEHIGRLKKKLLTLAAEREFEAVTQELSQSIHDNAQKTMPEMRSGQKTLLAPLSKFFHGVTAEHRKFASFVREMDGFKDGGVMWDTLVQGMNKAGDLETTMTHSATEDIAKLYAKLPGRSLIKQEFIPAIGKSLSMEERIGIALNTGNEVNRERVLTGERWTPQQLESVLDSLSAEHWNFVQSVWDYLESFRPQIAAKELRVTGVEPEWVQAQPVATKHGVFRGGYYPIKYDPLRSTKSGADAANEVQQQISRGLYTRAQTRRGHLKERVESTGRPMTYSLNVITQHVSQVIHDLAWHEWLIDANRIMRNDSVDSAIREHYRPEVLSLMRDSLKDIAVGHIPAQSHAERTIAYLRKGATITGLGWRLTTALLQPFGLTQSYVRLGPKYMVRGLGKWLGDAARMQNTTKWIYENSPFMERRAATLQREINEIENRVHTHAGNPLKQAQQAIEATAFYTIQKMQMTADIPTWLGAYYKFMDQPDMTEAKAFALADQTVIDTQGSGMIKDLAAIQKGSEWKKLWTNFYSFFNTTYNLAAEQTKARKLTTVAGIGGLASDYLMLFVVPSVLYTAMRTSLGKSSWDDFLKQAIDDEIGYIMGTMVGLRDLAGAFSGFDFRGPAGTRAFADIVNLGKQIEQGVVDSALVKAASETLGILFHLPTGQLNTTMDGIVSLSSHETDNPGALIVGKPLKK